MPFLNTSKKAPTSYNIVKIMRFVIPKSTSDLQKLKISKISKTMILSRSNGIKLNKTESSPWAYLNKFVSTNILNNLIEWKLSRIRIFPLLIWTHFSVISVKVEVMEQTKEVGRIYLLLCTNKFNLCNLITTSICKQLNMLHNQQCLLECLLDEVINLPNL